ncbi:unnamed protein product [Larinioides sclopetarius]|uniref:Uncharacterized protein n=1 Tax=Larinioides sclopetarius TaxID=280406 RepID=A0AAV2APU7_9ARAC
MPCKCSVPACPWPTGKRRPARWRNDSSLEVDGLPMLKHTALSFL